METAAEVVNDILRRAADNITRQVEDRVGGHNHFMTICVSEKVGGICIASDLERMQQYKLMKMVLRSIEQRLIVDGLLHLLKDVLTDEEKGDEDTDTETLH